ncbi:hypothetical protein APV37_03070 [Staphylococcus aureus]|nr:hypothetical protein APV37_03070 [Staphylococcus aureus]
MNQHLLGNPKLTVTHVNEVKTGINHIVVDSVQYGNQEMIMEKDVTVEMRRISTVTSFSIIIS